MVHLIPKSAADIAGNPQSMFRATNEFTLEFSFQSKEKASLYVLNHLVWSHLGWLVWIRSFFWCHDMTFSTNAAFPHRHVCASLSTESRDNGGNFSPGKWHDITTPKVHVFNDTKGRRKTDSKQALFLVTWAGKFAQNAKDYNDEVDSFLDPHLNMQCDRKKQSQEESWIDGQLRCTVKTNKFLAGQQGPTKDREPVFLLNCSPTSSLSTVITKPKLDLTLKMQNVRLRMGQINTWTQNHAPFKTPKVHRRHNQERQNLIFLKFLKWHNLRPGECQSLMINGSEIAVLTGGHPSSLSSQFSRPSQSDLWVLKHFQFISGTAAFLAEQRWPKISLRPATSCIFISNLHAPSHKHNRAKPRPGTWP